MGKCSIAKSESVRLFGQELTDRVFKRNDTIEKLAYKVLIDSLGVYNTKQFIESVKNNIEKYFTYDFKIDQEYERTVTVSHYYESDEDMRELDKEGQIGLWHVDFNLKDTKVHVSLKGTYEVKNGKKNFIITKQSGLANSLKLDHFKKCIKILVPEIDSIECDERSKDPVLQNINLKEGARKKTSSMIESIVKSNSYPTDISQKHSKLLRSYNITPIELVRQMSNIKYNRPIPYEQPLKELFREIYTEYNNRSSHSVLFNFATPLYFSNSEYDIMTSGEYGVILSLDSPEESKLFKETDVPSRLTCKLKNGKFFTNQNLFVEKQRTIIIYCGDKDFTIDDLFEIDNNITYPSLDPMYLSKKKEIDEHQKTKTNEPYNFYGHALISNNVLSNLLSKYQLKDINQLKKIADRIYNESFQNLGPIATVKDEALIMDFKLYNYLLYNEDLDCNGRDFDCKEYTSSVRYKNGKYHIEYYEFDAVTKNFKPVYKTLIGGIHLNQLKADTYIDLFKCNSMTDDEFLYRMNQNDIAQAKQAIVENYLQENNLVISDNYLDENSISISKLLNVVDTIYEQEKSKSIIEEYSGLSNNEIILQGLKRKKDKSLNEFAIELSKILGINHKFVTEEEAERYCKENGQPYFGNEGAFVFGNTVYLVKGKVTKRTVLHEFLHPVLASIGQTNPEIIEDMFNKLMETHGGKRIYDIIKNSELYSGLTEMQIMQECLCYSVQTEKKSDAYVYTKEDSFNNALEYIWYKIRRFFRNVFNMKNAHKIHRDMTIQDLVDMILIDNEKLKTEIQQEKRNSIEDSDMNALVNDIRESHERFLNPLNIASQTMNTDDIERWTHINKMMDINIIDQDSVIKAGLQTTLSAILDVVSKHAEYLSKNKTNTSQLVNNEIELGEVYQLNKLLRLGNNPMFNIQSQYDSARKAYSFVDAISRIDDIMNNIYQFFNENMNNIENKNSSEIYYYYHLVQDYQYLINYLKQTNALKDVLGVSIEEIEADRTRDNTRDENNKINNPYVPIVDCINRIQTNIESACRIFKIMEFNLTCDMLFDKYESTKPIIEEKFIEDIEKLGGYLTEEDYLSGKRISDIMDLREYARRQGERDRVYINTFGLNEINYFEYLRLKEKGAKRTEDEKRKFESLLSEKISNGILFTKEEFSELIKMTKHDFVGSFQKSNNAIFNFGGYTNSNNEAVVCTAKLVKESYINAFNMAMDEYNKFVHDNAELISKVLGITGKTNFGTIGRRLGFIDKRFEKKTNENDLTGNKSLEWVENEKWMLLNPFKNYQATAAKLDYYYNEAKKQYEQAVANMYTRNAGAVINLNNDEINELKEKYKEAYLNYELWKCVFQYQHLKPKFYRAKALLLMSKLGRDIYFEYTLAENELAIFELNYKRTFNEADKKRVKEARRKMNMLSPPYTIDSNGNIQDKTGEELVKSKLLLNYLANRISKWEYDIDTKSFNNAYINKLNEVKIAAKNELVKEAQLNNLPYPTEEQINNYASILMDEWVEDNTEARLNTTLFENERMYEMRDAEKKKQKKEELIINGSRDALTCFENLEAIQKKKSNIRAAFATETTTLDIRDFPNSVIDKYREYEEEHDRLKDEKRGFSELSMGLELPEFRSEHYYSTCTTSFADYVKSLLENMNDEEIRLFMQKLKLDVNAFTNISAHDIFNGFRQITVEDYNRFTIKDNNGDFVYPVLGEFINRFYYLSTFSIATGETEYKYKLIDLCLTSKVKHRDRVQSQNQYEVIDDITNQVVAKIDALPNTYYRRFVQNKDDFTEDEQKDINGKYLPRYAGERDSQDVETVAGFLNTLEQQENVSNLCGDPNASTIDIENEVSREITENIQSFFDDSTVDNNGIIKSDTDILTSKGYKYYRQYENEDYYKLSGYEKELLDRLTEFYLSIQEGANNEHKLGLDFPRFRVETKERITSSIAFLGTGKAQYSFDRLIGHMFRNTKEYIFGAEDDYEIGGNVSLKQLESLARKNAILKESVSMDTKLPIQGKYDININDVSTDILSTIFRYNISLKRVRSYQQSIAELGIIRDTFLGNNKTKEKKSADLNEISLLFETQLEGKLTEGILENIPILRNLTSDLSGATAGKFFKYHPISEMKNEYGPILQLIVEESGESFMGVNPDMNWAFKEASLAILELVNGEYKLRRSRSKRIQMLLRFQLIPNYSKSHYSDPLYHNIARSITNNSFAMLGRKERENFANLVAGFYYMKRIKIKDSNGTEHSLPDAYDVNENGELVVKNNFDARASWLPVYHKILFDDTFESIAKKYNIYDENGQPDVEYIKKIMNGVTPQEVHDKITIIEDYYSKEINKVKSNVHLSETSKKVMIDQLLTRKGNDITGLLVKINNTVFTDAVSRIQRKQSWIGGSYGEFEIKGAERNMNRLILMFKKYFFEMFTRRYALKTKADIMSNDIMVPTYMTLAKMYYDKFYNNFKKFQSLKNASNLDSNFEEDQTLNFITENAEELRDAMRYDAKQILNFAKKFVEGSGLFNLIFKKGVTDSQLSASRRCMFEQMLMLYLFPLFIKMMFGVDFFDPDDRDNKEDELKELGNMPLPFTIFDNMDFDENSALTYDVKRALRCYLQNTSGFTSATYLNAALSTYHENTQFNFLPMSIVGAQLSIGSSVFKKLLSSSLDDETAEMLLKNLELLSVTTPGTMQSLMQVVNVLNPNVMISGGFLIDVIMGTTASFDIYNYDENFLTYKYKVGPLSIPFHKYYYNIFEDEEAMKSFKSSGITKSELEEEINYFKNQYLEAGYNNNFAIENAHKAVANKYERYISNLDDKLKLRRGQGTDYIYRQAGQDILKNYRTEDPKDYVYKSFGFSKSDNMWVRIFLGNNSTFMHPLVGFQREVEKETIGRAQSKK